MQNIERVTMLFAKVQQAVDNAMQNKINRKITNLPNFSPKKPNPNRPEMPEAEWC
jgi:hypothetical protein